MNFKVILVLVEYISNLINSLYNKTGSAKGVSSELGDAVETADNGDQRDLEQKIFDDGGNPSAGVYRGLSKRKTKKR